MAKSKSSFVSKFTKAVGGSWDEARETEDQFGQVDIPDGSYVGQVSSMRAGIDKNDNPYVTINVEVTEGKMKGKRPSRFHGIADRGRRTKKQALDFLCIDLQRMGHETKNLKISDIEPLLETINEEKPTVRFSIKNHPTFGPNLNILGLINDDDAEEEDEDVEYEDEEETDEETDEEIDEEYGDDDEEESADLDEEEEEYEEEEWTPAKGERVVHIGLKTKPKCTITAVIKSKETVNLRNGASKKIHKNVPWAKLELLRS